MMHDRLTEVSNNSMHLLKNMSHHDPGILLNSRRELADMLVRAMYEFRDRTIPIVNALRND